MLKTSKILPIALAAILLAGIATTPALIAQAQAQAQAQFGVTLNANDITRGQMQILKVQATEGPAKVILAITYASGHKVLATGETDESGALDYQFRVGGNSKPGTFDATVYAVSKSGFATNSTSFEVAQKAPAEEEPEPAPEPTPGNETAEPTPLPPVTNETQPTPTNETQPEPPIVCIQAPCPGGNETQPVPSENVTEPVENDTTTAPEEPVVIAPENETTTVTPDNSTDISIPVNDTSVVIPSNETTVPEPTQNETEVIVAPENETEIVTPDNATQVPEIPPEEVENINETSVVVPGNETEVAENITVSEPEPVDVVPEEGGAGNVTEVVVVPPVEGEGEVVVNATEPEPQPEPIPEQNDTAPSPSPVGGGQLTPEEEIEQAEEVENELEEAIDEGDEQSIQQAMVEAIQAIHILAKPNPNATDEEQNNAQEKVDALTDLIDQAMQEVSE